MKILDRVIRFFRLIWGEQPVGWKTLLPALVLTVVLLALPTGFEGAQIYQGTEKVRAAVLEVDDSAIVDAGLLRTGEQYCRLRIEEGNFAGQETWAANLLSGSLSRDKIFAPGDNAFVVVSQKDGQITTVTMIDHYRLHWEGLLALLFAALLILFAGPGGLRALLSFVITVLAVWKIMIPSCLKGYDPIAVGVGVVSILTVVIIVFVYGFDRRSLVAVSGSMLGVLTACLLGMVFTDALQIHGAIMTESEALLYSGYESLDLTRIFMASIFIGASGAMMDLSVDITSGITEVVRKKPGISAREAIGSGMRIGQAAMGTMTTTLLLAYAGSCLTQLMVFMAQGTPILNILNYKYIAGEILHTLAGSFGLVMVAPFTAVVGGLLLTDHRKSSES